MRVLPTRIRMQSHNVSISQNTVNTGNGIGSAVTTVDGLLNTPFLVNAPHPLFTQLPEPFGLNEALTKHLFTHYFRVLITILCIFYETCKKCKSIKFRTKLNLLRLCTLVEVHAFRGLLFIVNTVFFFSKHRMFFANQTIP